MNDNQEKDTEALSRAERIKAIKNALHSQQAKAESEVPAEEPAAELSEAPADEVNEVPSEPNSEEEPEKSAVEEENIAESEPSENTVPVVEESPETDVPDAMSNEHPQIKEDIAPADNEDLAETKIMKVPEERPPSLQPVHQLHKKAEPVMDAPKAESTENAPLGSNNIKPWEQAAPSSAEAVVPPKKKKKKRIKQTVGQRLRSFFPEKGDSFWECLRKIVFLCSLVAIIVCGYLVADYYLDLWRNSLENNSIAELYNTYPVKNQNDDKVKEEKYYDMLTGARKLMDINPEVIGYMTIEGTPVDLPVVQAKDNEKYLDINFNGNESRAGALFLDYRNHYDDVTDHHLNCENSDNLVVYGHNMGDDSMFGCLKYYYRNVDYYEKHPVIQFNSNYAAYTYKIFAFFIVDADDETETKYDCWNKLDFDDEKAFYKFVNEAKRRTLRLNDVDVKYGDKLLTLSTCNDDVLVDRGRLIVMARLVREGEDPIKGTVGSKANPNIKWPTMYYNTNTNEKYDPEAEFFPYGPEK